MRILLERTHYDDKQTLGRLHLLDDNNHIIKTWDSLELPWKSNKRKISCIPEYTYKAIKHSSPKFGKVLWIQDVPNRDEILIHKGNYHSDILGCILIGLDLSDINKDGYLDVTSSSKAMKQLMELVTVDEIEIKITHI